MAYRQYRRNYSARGRRSRRSSRYPVRTTHWYRQANVPFGDSLLSGPAALDLLPDDVLDPGARLGATVTRVHLKVDAYWTPAIAALPDWHMYFGLYVGPGAPAAQIPSPATALNAVDWFFWETLSVHNVDNGTILNETAASYSVGYTRDVKSQRRFYEPTDKVWAVAELRNNAGYAAGNGPTVTVSVLIKK